eukprot:790977-Rhodomonas_salina.1
MDRLAHFIDSCDLDGAALEQKHLSPYRTLRQDDLLRHCRHRPPRDPHCIHTPPAVNDDKMAIDAVETTLSLYIYEGGVGGWKRLRKKKEVEGFRGSGPMS